MILCRMFEHPLLQDSKLDKRKQWWSEFLAGKYMHAFMIQVMLLICCSYNDVYKNNQLIKDV